MAKPMDKKSIKSVLKKSTFQTFNETSPDTTDAGEESHGGSKTMMGSAFDGRGQVGSRPGKGGNWAKGKPGAK